MRLSGPSRLSDEELTAEVKRLAHCEREATLDLIIHLVEFDKRRLYLGAGFSSLFTYATEVLRLSEHAAYHRILAARMARRFPVVLRMLAQGSLMAARTAAPPPPSRYGPAVTPLAAERYQITFTASAETREKLRFVHDLMRHRIPHGDTAAIFDEALTALLEKLARGKFAATERPRASRGTANELGPGPS